MVYYTGNRYTGKAADPSEGEMVQTQCLATGTPERLEKHGGNPVLVHPPGFAENHFRDPRVWSEGGLMHMVVGGTDGRDSRVAYFSSLDGLDWDYRADLLAGMDARHGGVWECPDC